MFTKIISEYQRQISMVYETNRLTTFKNWVFDTKASCNALKMAEAGFYSVESESEPDLVQCFCCGKALDGWEEDDDPWVEHSKHQKNCAFVVLHKPQALLTMAEFADIQLKMLANIVDRYYAELSTKDELDMNSYLDVLEDYLVEQQEN